MKKINISTNKIMTNKKIIISSHFSKNKVQIHYQFKIKLKMSNQDNGLLMMMSRINNRFYCKLFYIINLILLSFINYNFKNSIILIF